MNSKRVLIVDDQGDLRKLVRMTLEFGDYELHEAEDGRRALELVRSIAPDIVILDVMMPGTIDGYEVCRQIKDNEDTKSIYVILLTARGQVSDLDQGLAAGADDYLIKPFRPMELIELLREPTDADDAS